LGSSWVNLFKRPFHVSKSVSQAWNTTLGTKCPKEVRYNTGQPMGALSSWPFMALVHHILVWCSFGSRNASKGEYLILGDDIVIFNEKAYKKYLSLLDDLNVSYTNNISTVGFEFAKRNFLRGSEITGAYTAALYASRNCPELFAFEWRNLSSRGYDTSSSLPSSLYDFLGLKKYQDIVKIKRLLSVPYGSDVSRDQIMQFYCFLTSRSLCVSNNEENFLLAETAIKQASALVLKHKYQTALSQATEAIAHNKNCYEDALMEAQPELADKFPAVFSEAVTAYKEFSLTHIYLVEFVLKDVYMGSHDVKLLLRPELPIIPRKIDFKKRDYHVEKLKFRAEHQLSIMSLFLD